MKHLFTIIYLGVIVVEMMVRVPRERVRRQITKTDQRITRTERGLLGGLFVGVFVLPLLYALTPWLKFADFGWSSAARTRAGALGASLIAGALWLFWRAHEDLGANWSPSLEIGERHQLITRGIYGKIRHPMYASQWVWSLAQPLLLPNWIAGLSSLITFVPLYLIRVPREEGMMLDHFGDDYRSYCQRTGRIMPKALASLWQR